MGEADAVVQYSNVYDAVPFGGGDDDDDNSKPFSLNSRVMDIHCLNFHDLVH